MRLWGAVRKQFQLFGQLLEFPVAFQVLPCQKASTKGLGGSNSCDGVGIGKTGGRPVYVDRYHTVNARDVHW